MAITAASPDEPRKLKALDKRPELPDITSIEPLPVDGPKLSWGPPASRADANRRKANLALEKLGLRPPSRW